MHVNILVEGQTEEKFVNDLLAPFLQQHAITIKPILISTKKLRDGTKFKGGLSRGNYSSFESDLKRLIRSTPHGLVTTFIDYYALPSQFPKFNASKGQKTKLEKIRTLETALHEALGSPQNFIAHIQLHEFESLLFSDAKGFEATFEDDGKNIATLNTIIATHPNPEDIDDGNLTAPSKRILAVYSKYDKIVHGNLIAAEIGMEKFMERCPHFRAWVEGIVGFARRGV